MASYFIEDGQERRVYIEGVDGLYPSCYVTYRPLGAVARAAALRKIDEAKEPVLISAQIVAEQVVGWTIDAEINQQTVLTLEYNLQNRIRNVVLHLDAPDEDPAGRCSAEHGDKIEEAQQGNSSTG